MKSVGITRRIDNLGRVVIPRDIRRILHIREGDTLEIYVDDEFVMFRKRLVEEDAGEILNDLEETIWDHPNQQQLVNMIGEVRKALKTDKAPDAAATAIERKKQ